jgi:hypothetical protein
MTGVELIAKERTEQLKKHGWDAAHDDNHKEEQLLSTALYALTEDVDYWPDDWCDDYMIKIAAKDPKERLVVAGALIAAEIDRLERAGE